VHPGAYEFVGRFATQSAVRVIEIGSRDINGSVRSHFPSASWIGLDQIAGPAVDVVCNALDYTPSEQVDLVICCEVFEHTNEWPFLIHRAKHWLKPGGRIIITCAGIGRAVHSAIDGGHELHFGEFYRNVSERQLSEELHFAGLQQIEVSGNEHWHDTYGTAIKS